MPNQELINTLLGTMDADSSESALLLLNGDSKREGFDADTLLYSQRMEAARFHCLYLYNVGEMYFNDIFNAAYSRGTFTTLGLEAVPKGALKKIISSLPVSVTKIGIDKLTVHATGYLLERLPQLFAQGRQLEIVCGNKINKSDTARFKNLNSLPATPAQQHKRKKPVDEITEAVVIKKHKTLAGDKESSVRTILHLHDKIARLSKTNKQQYEEIKTLKARVEQFQHLEESAGFYAASVQAEVDYEEAPLHESETNEAALRKANEIMLSGKPATDEPVSPFLSVGRLSIFASPALPDHRPLTPLPDILPLPFSAAQEDLFGELYSWPQPGF